MRESVLGGIQFQSENVSGRSGAGEEEEEGGSNREWWWICEQRRRRTWGITRTSNSAVPFHVEAARCEDMH